MKKLTCLAVIRLFWEERENDSKGFLSSFCIAIGYWLLAIGYWLLAIGYWLLAIGYWLLAIGYIKNAQSPIIFSYAFLREG
jgi:hypothetical protein